MEVAAHTPLADYGQLRILHLEDNALDRELVRLMLAETGAQCEFTYASNRAEFEAALERGGFELILSDFTLDGYDGAAALVASLRLHPEIPFLFVSGMIGEEQAIASLKSGATDYVLKNNLQRLVPAVRRALQESGERVQRKQAEESLRQSEQRFRDMAESIRDVFWVMTPDRQRVLYVSPAYETIWGQSADRVHANPASWLEAIVPDDRPRVLAAIEQLAQGTDYRIEYRVIQPNGALRSIEDRGFAVRNSDGKIERTLGVATDITERKELEDQLRQAQKMEAIGQLAAGVAHDFNNMLTVITGHARMILDAVIQPEQTQESLRQIYLAGERAANLTRQLLVFSRKHRLHMETLDLNQVIDDVAKMLRRLIGENIDLEFSWGRGLPLIRADAGMMEQVLMNLAVNTRDAMPHGGRLTIKTEACVVSEEEAKRSAGARPGRFVCLSVRDTGSGIAPEILPRIFEPFFTTKEPGKGTGLGLATVFGIVQQHAGWIVVDSAVGVVTTFKIYLPEAPIDAATSAAMPNAEPGVAGGQETILLVEDEASVREFAVAVLQRYGYRVLQAVSGVDALETWKWHGARISLLVTDLVMPENMTGYELAQKLQAEKPSLKVICVSGYSGDMMEQVFTPEKGMQFLPKPYQPRQLAKAVRDALDGSQPSARIRPTP